MNANFLRDIMYKREDINVDKVENVIDSQLEKASTIKMYKRGFTIREFLHQTGAVNLYSSLKRADREEVDSFVKSTDYTDIDELQILLKLQHKYAVDRMPLIVPVVNGLRILIMGFPLPDLCAEIILRYLTNLDLENTIKAATIGDDTIHSQNVKAPVECDNRDPEVHQLTAVEQGAAEAAALFELFSEVTTPVDVVEWLEAFGRVPTIPPVYERQTASNISIEHGVGVKGLETCNLKHRQSSASRGVRSQAQLPMADLFAPVKVETIPLLSPSMELELMREPWSFPREPATYAIVNPITNQPQQQQQQTLQTNQQQQQQQRSNVNATTPLSAWEENFQDLSGWCMTGIQARCDFPAGESAMASKLTGTRIEGSSDVLTAANGATRNLMKTNNNHHSNNLDGGTDDEVVASPTHDHAYTLAGHNHHHQQQQQQQQQQMYVNSAINANGKSRAMNTWMTKDVKTESSNVWQELTDLGIITIPSDNATTATITAAPIYQAQFDELETKPDVFQSIDADAPNNFDLLSYLCDGDIPSPNDSISTDSSRVTDVNSLPSTASSAHVVVSPRTYEPIAISASSTPNDALKARLQAADSPLPHESPKHSPLSSASSELTLPTRHSYRQLRSIIKIEKPDSPPPTPLERRSTRPRRSRTISTTSSFSGSSRGRKRRLDESDDDDDDDEGDEDGGYREVREKNNEASRKSRMNKKAKEMEMARRAVELEKDNRILKMKVEELEKLVNSMRNALLRSALKREVKSTNMF